MDSVALVLFFISISLSLISKFLLLLTFFSFLIFGKEDRFFSILRTEISTVARLLVSSF